MLHNRSYLPLSLASEWLLFTTFSQLEFFGTVKPVEAGLLRRNPKRVLRYGAPAASFFGGDNRGVERPVSIESNVSIDSTESQKKERNFDFVFIRTPNHTGHTQLTWISIVIIVSNAACIVRFQITRQIQTIVL